MSYIRTKDRIYSTDDIGIDEKSANTSLYGIYKLDCKPIYKKDIVREEECVTDLFDEIVLIDQDGTELKITFLSDIYEKAMDNQYLRLVGRIKVGYDKKAVAVWLPNEKGLWDWVLL